jgi:hypothetical protein
VLDIVAGALVWVWDGYRVLKGMKAVENIQRVAGDIHAKLKILLACECE